MTKADPSKVNPEMAREALRRAEVRVNLFTEYILVHYAKTRKLPPGCDLPDLIAWCEQNEPARLQEITMPVSSSSE